MNQILETKTQPHLAVSFKSPKKFQFIFWFSSFILIFSFIFYFFLQYHALQNEKLSHNLTSSFSLQKLYTNNNYYTTNIAQTNLENKSPFVIGILKIDKIQLVYPILSNISKELLEISPCRFYGPMPNEIGNLCIAGHNYANQTHFAKISSLVNGDIIQIYDLNNSVTNYKVFDKLEVNVRDTSCLNQNTNGLREITLVTCNTIKGTRFVIKAKENR